MQITDFSPPTVPSLDQQRDALQKGLGRAVQWAMAGKLSDEALLDACLHDKRCDHAFEENRGGWLWSMLNIVGAEKRFRGALLEGMWRVKSEGEACQLCELAFHFAKAGDIEFQVQLHDVVERRPIADCPWVGDGQLLRLCGEEGFRFIARIRGGLLESREWSWDDSQFADSAVEQLTEARVCRLLEDSGDSAINRFAAGWKRSREDSGGSSASLSSNELRGVKAEEVLKTARSNDQYFWFPRWGKQADENDLQEILCQLWTVGDPELLAKLLRVFWFRPLPHFDSRLIGLCRNKDECVRWRAICVLAQNVHPAIREFALTELQHNELGWSWAVVGLLVRNFCEGDERRLLSLLEMPDDAWERHRLLIDLRNVLAENPTAEYSELGLVGYFHTPCEVCRRGFVEMLAERGSAPAWLLEECQYDSAEDCRTLVQADPTRKSDGTA